MQRKTTMGKKGWLRAAVLFSAGLFILASGAAAQQENKRLRVSADAQHSKLVANAAPVYPVLAKRARIEGKVRLQAVIGKDGAVEKVEVVSGHAVLAQAATEAVQKWRYKPTELNGEPVEVVTNIDIVFKLT